MTLFTLIKSCHSYPGAEVDSYHKLVMEKCCLKYKKHRVKSKKPLNWDLQSLKDTEIKELFANSTKENVKEKYGQIDRNSIKEGILNAANTTLKSERLVPRKPWITK